LLSEKKIIAAADAATGQITAQPEATLAVTTGALSLRLMRETRRSTLRGTLKIGELLVTDC